MAIRFHVEEELAEDLVARVAALAPTNPFYTWNYVLAMQNLGERVVLLCLSENDQLLVACTAGMRTGFMRREIGIWSLPGFDRSELADEFWNGLVSFCRGRSVTDLVVETYATPGQKIPDISGEVRRISRSEFVLNLAGSDLRKKLRKSHRSRVNKGAKSDLAIRRASDEAACRDHVENCFASGEKYTAPGAESDKEASFRYYMNFLKTGAGELFQAVDGDGGVVSSVLVLKAANGAYTHSSGSLPSGMKLGASHFLKHRTSVMLQEDGLAVLNLAGAAQGSEGLAEFKAGFGGERIELEAAEFYLGNRLKKSMRGALIQLRHSPLQLIRDLCGQVEASQVFVVDPREVTRPDERPELEFKKLSDEDLRAMATEPGEMGTYAQRFVNRSFNDGWAVWTEGRLAHVNWMITAEHDRLLPIRNVKLRRGEIEITHGITDPKFRGRGICPWAIRRLLCLAGEQGITRAWSIAGVNNLSSHHAIQKGGLSIDSRIYRVVFTYLPGNPYFTFRGHRWKRLGRLRLGQSTT
jgi:RimJ/RimL family protein N-acetyltransferase